MNSQWPPPLSEEELVIRHNHMKDWQITHGSLIKLFRTDEGHSVLSRPIGVTMFPTLFPRSSFEHALALQKIYNQLYVRIAEDTVWLEEALKDLIASNQFAKTLWTIHKDVSEIGYCQPITLGIFRSDYMLHVGDFGSTPHASAIPKLKQVEFNSFSVAGGSHANIVTDMHHHLERLNASGSRSVPSLSALPSNCTIHSIVQSLVLAHDAYGSREAPHLLSPAFDLAILFVVQPNNINICDERPLEYALWNQNPSIPSFRAEFPDDILNRTFLDKSRRLLYRPFPDYQPNRVFEISVVYLRAGYDAEEYTENGVAARLQLEKSYAIKCPSILSHLTTFKKVQQALAERGVLERFLSLEESNLISNTFAPLLPLDTSQMGQQARRLAMNPKTAINYVLKPSLEGGGHNVYGKSIPAYLETIDESQWPHYILQEMIKPPTNVHNILLSHRGIYRGPVVSELGVFGAVIWQREGNDGQPKVLYNGGPAGGHSNPSH